MSIYELNLDRNPANYVPLSPVSFLLRAARMYGPRVAVIHGERRYSYAQFLERARRWHQRWRRRVWPQATLSRSWRQTFRKCWRRTMPCRCWAQCCARSTSRLDAGAVTFILQHSEAKVVLVDREFSAVMARALAQTGRKPLVVDIDDALGSRWRTDWFAEYEAFIAARRPGISGALPDDEWQAIALNYTSGTTGNPKGVVLHHRGAYLNACGNALTFGLSPRSVYLWTLPMFHCNGWTYTWAVTLAGGTHVCLRRVEPAPIFAAIADHGVTHMCGAPVVLSMLIHAPDEARRAFTQTVQIATGGAAPPCT